MTLDYAKQEINRYMALGIDRSDVACLLASWGLTIRELEDANKYLHDWEIDQIDKLIRKGRKI